MSQTPSKKSGGKPSSSGGGSRGRPEKSSGGSLLLYLSIIATLAVLIGVWFNRDGGVTKLSWDRFEADIKNGRFNAENVRKLTKGREHLTFQCQETVTVGGHTENAVRRYSVPALGATDRDWEQLREQLSQKSITVNFEDTPPEWLALLYPMLLALPLIIFFLIMLRRSGGAGSALSFGRSRGKMLAEEDLDVTFDQVAGIDEAVEEVRELVEFLRTPGKYQALGGRIPRGVLLVGPPGTGKTLLAKAIAGEAGVPFFSLSGSDFVEMFVGVGAARVRDMFGQAGAKAPSIIFIDELDALGKVRGSGLPGSHDEREQTLNALLVEMDGFPTDQSVIVMAATNRPETLDPALMRPGRFDRQVLVDKPDVKGREAILKVHIGKIKADDDIDLKHLAKLTPGFVGADLANLVNEAALLAARKSRTRVMMAEFEEAIERVVAGLEKQTRLIPEDEKRRVAIHECGHALVACSLPGTDPVHKISIIPRGLAALGYTLQRPSDDRYLHTQSELEHRICVLLGGIAAEELIYKETSTGAQNDLERASDIARRMVTEFGMSPRLGRVNYRDSGRSPFAAQLYAPTPEVGQSEQTRREIDLEVKRIIDEAAHTVQGLLINRRPILEQMSKELFEKEVMDANDIRRIMDAHTTTPQLVPGTGGSLSTGNAEPNSTEGSMERPA